MFRKVTTTSNTLQEQDHCNVCVGSFGIQHARIPLKCIDVECSRHYCAQCVQMIHIINGDDRRFQCMCCLRVYRKGQQPEKNELLIKQLSDEACIKYGIKRTRQLLLNQCSFHELILDIDCRRRHLINLIAVWKRLFGQAALHKLLIDAQKMANELAQTIEHVKGANNDNIELCKQAYRDAISTSNSDGHLGASYISLCEDFQLEISEAEYRSIFPKTCAKMNEWLHPQGSAGEFQPKILDLFEVIEQDLINQWSDLYLTTRIKIGVVGYMSSGKSSLINRLLGVKSLTEDDASPVSIGKSTYFPLQYHRKEPLVAPDNPDRITLVTLVDIHGLEKNRIANNSQMKAGNHLDEIRKADCDIYMLVYDDEFSEEQHLWIEYIEQVLRRKCVLVRSKVDIYYLIKFQELSGTLYGVGSLAQRTEFGPVIKKQLTQDSSVGSRSSFLVACGYTPASLDAALLSNEESFEFSELLNELSRLAFDASSRRIHTLANRAVARVINTSFRRGYILNVMKYKVAAGIASVIPFGDQLARYLARDSIRDAFGFDKAFRQYLTQFQLIIDDYLLQTSVFEDFVEIKKSRTNAKPNAKCAGKVAGTALIVGAGFGEDLLRLLPPVATALSGAARVAFTVATMGVGVAISVVVCAWSAIDSGDHIFSYINRVCDDIIMITDPLVASIIEREREKIAGKNPSTTSTADSVQNKQ